MDLILQTFNDKWKLDSEECNIVCNLNGDTISSEDVDSKWQDLPMELLVQILALVDHRTVIVACGVCTGWRDAMRFGILELSFSWCKRNTSMLVQSVAPKFTQLQVCDLRNNRLFLSDQAIRALANHCRSLRVLDLSNGTLITDVSLYALAHGCGMLERLNLSGCIRISELGLTALAENCNNLMHLNLCGCSNAGTDQALLALAQNCIMLKSLNVGWCERITDIGVMGLASWCSYLMIVDLCGCLLITDCSVIALADNCHHLGALGLYSCINITDAAMYALAKSSKSRIIQAQKQSSTLPHSHFMTREPLLKKKEGYGLVSLNLGMCTYLSAPAVQAVCDAFLGLHTCPERHSLNISGCLNLISVHCVCVIEAQREKEKVSHVAPLI